MICLLLKIDAIGVQNRVESKSTKAHQPDMLIASSKILTEIYGIKLSKKK